MSKKLPVWAIIPASGIGQRMLSERPKQYLPLVDKTIIEHTLDRLLSHPEIIGAVVVLSATDKYWESLNYQTQSKKPLIFAQGGLLRHQSVFNGLEKLNAEISQDCYSLVHDAVRPLVTIKDLNRLIKAARQHSAGALLGAPIADTIKQLNVDGNINQTVSRTALWRAFTPQLFKADLLMDALKFVIEKKIEITDDASAIEAIGLSPKLVLGSVENIKITLPEDLMLARQIWTRQMTSG
ncbi:MAG: 2-C-methyl-D-erythritol 4-phosphate cytidylyltransferase [Gammaproteobacteria bacterium]|jgi:2-C-methyl-D-erythritol 4-phosphate cytidylyltransferase